MAMKKEEMNPMLLWSKEQKFDYLVERLKDQMAEWDEWNDCGMCYTDEDSAYGDGQKSAYNLAADNLKWMLNSLGLLETPNGR